MAYTINCRVINDTADTLTVVEKSCWSGAGGTQWRKSESGRQLTMNASGSSGMLRFVTSNDEYFAVAVGVNNYKRWCDVTVNLSPSEPLTTLHPTYYHGDKNKELKAEAAEASAITSKGNKVTVTFYVSDGHSLWCNIVYLSGCAC